MSYYPFDVQNCTVAVIFYPMTSKQVSYLAYDSINKETQIANGKWDLIGASCESSSSSLQYTLLDGYLQSIQYKLIFRRRRTFYMLNYILPVVFLALTSSMVFLLPVETGERMSVTVTVLLAYSVYLSMISENIPENSITVCYLQMYLTLLFGINSFGVIMSVFVFKSYHISSDRLLLGTTAQTVVSAIRRLLCLRPCSRQNAARP